MKKFLYTLVLVTGFISVTAQNIESSFFLLNQVGSSNPKIKAKSSSKIVSLSFSNETMTKMFTFLKDADSMIYATLPYYLEVNDFVVLDSCIFFCGKNTIDSCGYIGILDVNFSTMNIGGYRYVDIPGTIELTKMIAYNHNEISTKYGAVAIGRPSDNNIKSCVVDLNNYSNNDSTWSYTIGFISKEYITDIELMTDENGNGEIVTVGQSVLSNSNIPDLPIVYSEKMYIRNYKRTAVLTSGMENTLHTYSYSSLRMSQDTPFKIRKLSNNKVAVSTVAELSNFNSTHCLEVKIIDLYSMYIENIQYITNSPGIFKEMTYFPSENKLGVLKITSSGVSEILLFDMGQTSNYTSNRIYRNNVSLNSIFCYDGTHFLVTGLDNNLVNPCLSLLQENINNFSTSECVSKGIAQVVSSSSSITPGHIGISGFNTDKYQVSFKYAIPSIYKTGVKLKCVNY